MINRLRIQNFQGHKDTELFFCTMANVIIGESDMGKSSIVKALSWLITGRPTGNSFASKFGGNVSVEADIDGATVVRSKGKKNEFYAVLENGETITPPDEVNAILNIGTINMSTQFDSHFLLSNSPGEAGRIINKAVKIDSIDRSLKKITSMGAKEKSELESVQKELQEEQKKLKKYDWIDSAEETISGLETLNHDIVDLKALVADLSPVVDMVDTMNRTLENKAYIANCGDDVDSAIGLHDYINSIRKDKNYLGATIKKIDNYENNLRDLKQNENSIDEVERLLILYVRMDVLKTEHNLLYKILDDVEEIEISILGKKKKLKACKDIEKLSTVHDNMKTVEGEYNSLYDIFDKIKTTEKSILSKKKRLKDSEKEFKNKMGNSCILCGGKI